MRIEWLSNVYIGFNSGLIRLGCRSGDVVRTNGVGGGRLALMRFVGPIPPSRGVTVLLRCAMILEERVEERRPWNWMSGHVWISRILLLSIRDSRVLLADRKSGEKRLVESLIATTYFCTLVIGRAEIIEFGYRYSSVFFSRETEPFANEIERGRME